MSIIFDYADIAARMNCKPVKIATEVRELDAEPFNFTALPSEVNAAARRYLQAKMDHSYWSAFAVLPRVDGQT